MIYKSTKKTNEYYFNNEPSKDIDIFGFYLTYNHKPCFFEYFEGTILRCNQLQITGITNSLKRYSKTTHFKEFKKPEKLWGYTIMRKKGSDKECVLKFVQPSNKGKIDTLKYPPGPGNVCIENNLASKIENLIKIIYLLSGFLGFPGSRKR